MVCAASGGVGNDSLRRFCCLNGAPFGGRAERGPGGCPIEYIFLGGRPVNTLKKVALLLALVLALSASGGKEEAPAEVPAEPQETQEPAQPPEDTPEETPAEPEPEPRPPDPRPIVLKTVC